MSNQSSAKRFQLTASTPWRDDKAVSSGDTYEECIQHLQLWFDVEGETCFNEWTITVVDTADYLSFSNPRLSASFSDWPLGGNKRGRCTFSADYSSSRGFRVQRRTENPKTGLENKPKRDTYGGRLAIVDGSDGRTYILQFAGGFDFIKITRSDFLSAGAVFPTGISHLAVPGYAALKTLIEAANS